MRRNALRHRIIEPRLRHLDRLGGLRLVPCQRRQPPHQRAHVLRAALAEIGEQGVEFGARQGRAFDQPQILVAAFAGQQRQLHAAFARAIAASWSQP